MFERLEGVEQRYIELERTLSDPVVIGNRDAYQKAVREHSELGRIVAVLRQYREVLQRLEESRQFAKRGIVQRFDLLQARRLRRQLARAGAEVDLRWLWS